MCELTLFTDNVKGVSLQNLECMKRITWDFREKSLLLIDFKYIYFLCRWIYLKIEVRCSEALLGGLIDNEYLVNNE